MKQNIFIASASKSVGIAADIQESLNYYGIKSQIWNQDFFSNSKNTLETLTEKLENFDFAIFIFSPDDQLKKKENSIFSTRDNVIFELGLFIGKIGRERTFFISTNEKNYQLPSDLDGISHLKFDLSSYHENGISELGPVTNSIRKSIEKTKLKKAPLDELFDVGIDQIAEFYKISALTQAYTKRDESIDDMFNDISKAKHSVSMYARVYLSNLIKSSERFSEAIISSLQDNKNSLLTLEHISTSYDKSNLPVIEQLWKHEDPKARRWKTIESYISHLQGSDSQFKDIRDEIVETIPSQIDKRRLQLKRSYISDILLPYSLLVIDNEIMYISFYTLTSKAYGTYAPTLRLTCKDVKTWGSFFLKQKEKIDRIYVNKSSLINI